MTSYKLNRYTLIYIPEITDPQSKFIDNQEAGKLSGDLYLLIFIVYLRCTLNYE
jgi:hypothetical protein